MQNKGNVIIFLYLYNFHIKKAKKLKVHDYNLLCPGIVS